METVKTPAQELIETKVAEILRLFNVTAQINSELVDGALRVDVQTSNDSLFVSGAADPLLALQHLLRVIFKTELSEASASLVLNIGDFQTRQQTDLAAIAEQAAEQAVISGGDVPLRPMSSYERRLVHMVLADHPNVVSVSEGEGPSRRIVVRPK
jgi:spoIIIJ-associated protein